MIVARAKRLLLIFFRTIDDQNSWMSKDIRIYLIENFEIEIFFLFFLLMNIKSRVKVIVKWSFFILQCSLAKKYSRKRNFYPQMCSYPREGISQDCKYRHTMKRTKRKSKLSQAVSFLTKNWTKIYITSFGYYLVNVSFDLSINRAATVAKYENLLAKELETVNSKPDFEAWKNSLGQKMRVKLSLREHILNKDSDN